MTTSLEDLNDAIMYLRAARQVMSIQRRDALCEELDKLKEIERLKSRQYQITDYIYYNQTGEEECKAFCAELAEIEIKLQELGE